MTVGWFCRQGIVFLLIVVAIIFYKVVLPKITSGDAKAAVKTEWTSAETINAKLVNFKKTAVLNFERFPTNLHTLTENELQESLNTKTFKLNDVTKKLNDRSSLLFPEIRPDAIIKTGQLNIIKKKLSAEIGMLELAQNLNKGRYVQLQTLVFPSRSDIKLSKQKCDDANKDVREFNKGYIKFRSDARKLTTAAKTQCDNFISKKLNRKAGLKKYNILKIRLEEESKIVINLQKQSLSSELQQFKNKEIVPIKSLLQSAFFVLLGIILMPFIVRTVFYYILAPIAASRASIRISVPDAGKVPIPLAQPSRIAVPVTLKRNEELLVRQGYLQTTSLVGKKETSWLLDNAHLFSSVASGLVFLTRIRGEGDITTVSAVRDPFAEMTEVTLPEGSSCVLHPRALVAVVHPAGQTIRISSHWRLLTLNAWLTMQLRYLVFHGPGKLIVKGGRGIRMEHAERGRIFGQDQLVGFSADLSYSVIRAETFAPYFFGREPLYKDKVEQGSGILIIEEAPNASRAGDGTRRGLEGVLEAGLKAFGI